MKALKKAFILTFIIYISFIGTAAGLNLKKGAKDMLQIGTALYLHGTIHEFGHMVVADHLDAKSSTIEFFTTKDGNFFFGLNTAKGLKKKSLVSYRMGGFVFSNMTYEFALFSYRQQPTTFNHALALFSASDFLRYSLFALYLGNSNVDEYDPVYFHKKSGFSKEAIVLTSLSQALINVYRLYSGNDTLIPLIEFHGDQLDNSILIGFKLKY